MQINAVKLPVQAWSKEKAGINKRLELNHQQDAYHNPHRITKNALHNHFQHIGWHRRNQELNIWQQQVIFFFLVFDKITYWDVSNPYTGLCLQNPNRP